MPLLTSLHVLSGAGLMARRAWIRHVDTEGLYGSDHHMLAWAVDNDHRAWCMFTVRFDVAGDAGWRALVQQVHDNVSADMARPDSNFRRGVSHATRRFVFYADRTADDLFEHTDDLAHLFRVNDPAKRELVLRFHAPSRTMAVLFDHTVWDGARIVNEILSPAITCKPFGSRWLVEERYWPGASEALQIYTAYRMGLRRLRHTPMQTLEGAQDYSVFDHRMTKQQVTHLKAEAGVGFTAAIVALWARKLFGWLTTDRRTIRMGLLVACKNPRHRNNYSVVIVDVHRTHDALATARSVARQLKRRAIEVLPMYQLLCNVDVQSLFKRQLVDCLFSPGPFEKGTGVSQSLQTMSFFAVPSTCAMYSFACTIDDTIAISSTYNCPELSREAMAAEAVQHIRYDDEGHVTAVVKHQPVGRAD